MGTALSEYEAKQVLADAGIPVVQHVLVQTADEAVDAAQDIGFPVVLKADAAGLQHKTDVGAVQVAHTVEAVRDRFQRIHDNVAEHRQDVAVDGLLVEEQVDGVELIVGTHQDPDFGTVIMFGLGGILVEVLADVQFRALPITETDANELVDGLGAQELLDGVRGRDPVNRDAIVDVLLAVSDLAAGRPDIDELDINPLFANKDGAVAADALITVDNSE